MALSRWSHSRWYIYDNGDGLSICTDGHVTLDELKNNFDESIQKIITEETSSSEEKELRLYLKYYLLFNEKQIDFTTYSKRIKQLRHIGYMRNYLYYQSLPFDWKYDGIPDNNVVYIRQFRKKSEVQKYRLKKEDHELSKPIEFISRFIPESVKITFQDEKHFSYRNPKNGYIVTEKFNERRHKLFHSDSPILLGVQYDYSLENHRIYNKRMPKNKEWVQKRKEQINSQLESLKEELNEYSKN